MNIGNTNLNAVRPLCPKCGSKNVKLDGKRGEEQIQQYYCTPCAKRFVLGAKRRGRPQKPPLHRGLPFGTYSLNGGPLVRFDGAPKPEPRIEQRLINGVMREVKVYPPMIASGAEFQVPHVYGKRHVVRGGE